MIPREAQKLPHTSNKKTDPMRKRWTKQIACENHRKYPRDCQEIICNSNPDSFMYLLSEKMVHRPKKSTTNFSICNFESLLNNAAHHPALAVGSADVLSTHYEED